MRKKFTIIIWVSLVSGALLAQDAKDYPCSVVKDKVVVSGFESFEGLSSDTIFFNALLWSINKCEQFMEGITDIDFGKRMFVSETSLVALRSSVPYHNRATFHVSENIMSFMVSDIVCDAEISMKITRKLPFEKLQPESKPKHKEYLSEFERVNSNRLNDMLEFIRTNRLPAITHIDKIKRGDVAKGMNETECLLSFGKPVTIQETGNKSQWMYDSYTYLFFEDGILTSVIK